VSGGAWDPARYEFVNYDVDEVRRDLRAFCEAIRSVNPTVRILLTVSPVPLIATYESRHVLVSTTWSKSVLRVAAGDATAHFDFVDYFPSFELISSATGPRNYYASDLREVEDIGVAHVMRSFARHYVDGLEWSAGLEAAVPLPAPNQAVVCDEEVVAEAIAASR
jgi:hypothetical protein